MSLGSELSSENETSESLSSDNEKRSLTLEFHPAPLTDDVLQKLDSAEALHLKKYPWIAMNSNRVIDIKRENCRKTESLKIMIVFVAISKFHYDTANTVQSRKTRRRILNAASRLVCYNEGYAEPNSDMKTIENFILSMNTYCKFDGSSMPIGNPLRYNTKSKVRQIMNTHPRLLLQCFRKSVRAISDKICT